MLAYIRVEGVSREFDAKMLLALCAAEAGFTVYLGEITQETLLRWRVDPGIFHDQSAYPEGQSIVKRQALLERGFLVSVQDEEHGLQYRDYRDFAAWRYSEESLSQVNALFCWGRHDHAELSRLFPHSAPILHTTGSPRADLWKPEFDALYSRADLPTLLQEKPYILVSSSVGAVANPMSMSEYVRLRRSTAGHIPPADFGRELARNISASGESAQLTIDFLASMSVHSRGVGVVLRPHPTEDQDFWRELTRGLEGVEISSDPGVSALVRHAQAVVHHRSSVAIEARIGRRPVVTLGPDSLAHKVFDFDHIGIGPVGSTAAAALVQRLSSSASPRHVALSPNEASYLGDRFGNLIGEDLAADGIVTTWIDLVAGRGSQSRSTPLARPRGSRKISQRMMHTEELRGRVGRLLARRISHGRWSHHNKREQMFPPMNPVALDSKLDRFRMVTGRFSHVTVEQLSQRVVRIRPKGLID